MSKAEWIVTGMVFSLIPAVLFLKMFLDNKREKVWRETQADIDHGIKELIDEVKSNERI